jgi:hypothetical protein
VNYLYSRLLDLETFKRFRLDPNTRTCCLLSPPKAPLSLEAIPCAVLRRADDQAPASEGPLTLSKFVILVNTGLPVKNYTAYSRHILHHIYMPAITKSDGR